jgi:hypothetical protein
MNLVAVLRIKDVLFGSDHFLIQDFFMPEPGSFMKKWNASLLFSCFLCFQEQILNHRQKDPRSGIRKNSSRIQGVKKHLNRIRNTIWLRDAPDTDLAGYPANPKARYRIFG